MESNGVPFLNFEVIFRKIYGLFTGNIDLSWLWNILSDVNVFLFTFLSIISLFFLFIIFYSRLRLKDVYEKEEKKIFEPLKVHLEEPKEKNSNWEKIEDLMKSTNPSDWRLAIIEADNMLEEMMIKMGYDGENLGERLKAVEPSDFNTLQNAWDAHKIRNKIAHEGLSFHLPHGEAQKAIDDFERVFREFNYI